MRSLFTLLFFVLFILETPTVNAQIGWTKSYENGVVVSAEERASEAGLKILEQGGNAVDAAVAVQFALAATLPRAGNIGGGGFMVIRMADGTTTTLDFREKAPLEATEDMYIRDGEYDPELSREGILSVGVPGVVDGMVKAIERYGRFPLETVMNPAIDLAREGYELSWMLADELNNHTDEFKKYDGSEEYFVKDNDEEFKEGDLFVQKDLAETLERIAHYGRSGFYSGTTADLIVEEMEREGGLITHKDLREYESVWRKPVETQFGEYKIYIMPPPSSGSIAFAQILSKLNDFDLEEMGFNSAEYVHVVAESMRRAFADRSHYLGDPDFTDIPQEKLLSGEYNKERMETFDPDKTTDSEDLKEEEISAVSEPSQTTHFSVVDNEGNAVAVTTTLNGSFGSNVAVSGAGFLLNNEMDDFTAEPDEPNMFGLIQGEANAIEPEKRMLSSMTPAIVTKDENVKMVLGAAGGPRIITATLQNFLNMAVFDMNAQQALSSPRIHHQWMPDELYYEKHGLSPDTKELLDEKGHNLKDDGTIGRSHVIYIEEDGVIHGAADPRGDGHTSGY